MKKYLLLLFLVNVTYLFSQNGIIGDGFGVNDWSTTDCFDSSAGSSRIFTANSNGTGTKYFRLVTCWDNNYQNWGPQNNDDKLLSYGTAYNSSDMIVDSAKAYFLNANSSYQYVFKTRESGNPPNNLGVVVFEVQGEIRTVSSVSNNATHSAGEPYTVTATLSGSLSPGQGVYLRYTNDSWNTSSVIEMTGNTTNYSASIPADVNVAQASISYYIFTSGSGLTISAVDSDFFTINSNTNSGNNYSYIVETLSISEEINPTNAIVTTTNGNIYFGNTGQYELEVFNVQGQLVHYRYFDILARGERVNIDLNRGIYLLKINAIESKKSSVKKILIK